MKYVVVSGGSVSGLGKGTAISSLGVVLRSHGLHTTTIKIDPYLNVDAGTMSPFEHGEVFVLDDGSEVDLDLGNYERFLEIRLTQNHSITTGKVYQRVIEAERRGDYLGKTVQIVPHVTNCVQEWIRKTAEISVDGEQKPNVCLIELGGTVGDIESAMYLEALQQFQFCLPEEDFCLIHLGYVPYMGVLGEQKTKPTQHSVISLRQAGLKPNFLFCRSRDPVEGVTRAKLSMFSQVPEENIISLHDSSSIYEVPLILEDQEIGRKICRLLKLPYEERTDFLERWREVDERTRSKNSCTIGVVGKYTGSPDTYISVINALKHAGLESGYKVEIRYIDSEFLEETKKGDEKYEEAWKTLKSVDGVLAPGGFGDRGIEGKVAASKYCRTEKVPHLGICLAFQTFVIDFARDHFLPDANSAEFVKEDENNNSVIIYMPETKDIREMGGTMRLGARVTKIVSKDTLAYKLYGKDTVVERHRHRYEVNPDFVERLESHGLIFSGRDETGRRMEIAELSQDVHPYFITSQFHPEFLSHPRQPSPLFLGLVLAASKRLEARLVGDGGVLKVGSGWCTDN